MAKSRNNVITHGLSGKVGDLVLFRQRFGKTFMGKIPVLSAAPSEKQLAVRERFLKAVRYASASLKDPAMKALYAQKAGGGVLPFNLAVVDYFTAPVIEDVNIAAYTGAAGSHIEVLATDDTKVQSVKVSITNAGGQPIEEGAAVQDGVTGSWSYAATVANANLPGTKITVLATDLPGNTATAEKLL